MTPAGLAVVNRQILSNVTLTAGPVASHSLLGLIPHVPHVHQCIILQHGQAWTLAIVVCSHSLYPLMMKLRLETE